MSPRAALDALGVHDVDHAGQLMITALLRPCVAGEAERWTFRTVVAFACIQILHTIEYVIGAFDSLPHFREPKMRPYTAHIALGVHDVDEAVLFVVSAPCRPPAHRTE
eukprot:5537432-Pleurochrysis_carterae.AAC.1